ncbi:hypothetical protein [Leptospira adleri]|uniref:Uncharacterized protein n=1 Tax=Leptospira adleri TaxID=2023186 RepID=A0A2M9YIB0_9LEPT|nr:hypothetical protein [Leptospira adleri]PJZ51248.1 hypothetical protein CH380_21150 [Leptospira adleri]PJZ59729.1 hypothetical protein CH376_22120 [Leptospira adleri]
MSENNQSESFWSGLAKYFKEFSLGKMILVLFVLLSFFKGGEFVTVLQTPLFWLGIVLGVLLEAYTITIHPHNFRTEVTRDKEFLSHGVQRIIATIFILISIMATLVFFGSYIYLRFGSK